MLKIEIKVNAVSSLQVKMLSFNFSKFKSKLAFCNIGKSKIIIELIKKSRRVLRAFNKASFVQFDMNERAVDQVHCGKAISKVLQVNPTARDTD